MPKIAIKRETQSFTVRLPVEFIHEIERISAKRGLTHSQVARMVIDAGLSIHKDMERAGVIAAVDFVHYATTAVKEKVNEAVKGKQLTLPL